MRTKNKKLKARFSHIRHTGRLLPHSHTSYPVLAMIVLCVGLLMGNWTHVVSAASGQDSYTVHGKYLGPAPTVAATIDSPNDGVTVVSTPITVSGTCPQDTYITLFRNGAFSGVALCDNTGAYQLETDLFPGNNILKAVDYNYTDVPGPDSNLVTIDYEPPVPVTPIGNGDSGGSSTSTATTDTPILQTGGQVASSGGKKPTPTKTSTISSGTSNSIAQGQTVAGEPLTLLSTFQYQGHYTGSSVTWQLTVQGGTAPYAISIDWGDGTRSAISRGGAGGFSVAHTYKHAGGYHGHYVATFTATDSQNNQTYLQLLSIVNDHPGAAAGSMIGDNSSGSSAYGDSLKYLWPSYGIVVLMVASFWLGERREFNYLKPSLRKRHHAH